MMDYTSDNLKILLLENDYPASNKVMLDRVVSQLQHMTEEGKQAFEHWCDTRNLPTFNVNGVTADYLRMYHHATAIAIILAFDGLVRNPKSAYLLKKPVIQHHRGL